MHHPNLLPEVLTDLSVYTQNIWGFPNILHSKDNLQNLLLSIQPYKPKVILLQEVFREKWLTSNSYYYSNYIPFYIKKRMFVVGGLVILLDKRIVRLLIELNLTIALDFTEFYQQGLLRSKQAVSRLAKKGYLTLTISNTDSTPLLILVNTHTTSSFNKRKNQINQKAFILIQQLNQLFDYLMTVCNSSTLVVGGDFNYDIVEFMPDSTCNYTCYPKGNETTLPKHNQCIDFVFTNLQKEFDYKIIIPGFNKNNSRQYSDHNGVLIYPV
jgi:hypothetical protein